MTKAIDPTHPLILWIRDRYATAAQKLHPVSAIYTTTEKSNLKAGLYAYAVYLWTFAGLRTESQIAYRLINVEDNQLLDSHTSESVLATLMQTGQIKPNASSFIEDIDNVIKAQAKCKEDLEDSFGKALEDFYEENDSRCDIQEKSALAFAERKQRELTARLERFKQSGKTRIIPATQGQLNKVNRELEVKLISIQQKRDDVNPDQRELAAGVIFVEEET